jgi:hypothetical protein
MVIYCMRKGHAVPIFVFRGRAQPGNAGAAPQGGKPGNLVVDDDSIASSGKGIPDGKVSGIQIWTTEVAIRISGG